MGNFYTNYTLKGPSQKAVATALAGRSAVVTPAQNDCVVVFDEKSNDQISTGIIELSSQLSRDLCCPVLSVLNHDDDILWYQLFMNGELLDEYDSSPSYFDPIASPSAPAGGDAKKLCDAFNATSVTEIERILRVSSFDKNGYAFAIERHAALARALGIPTFGVGSAFYSITNGELPDGLNEQDILRV